MKKVLALLFLGLLIIGYYNMPGMVETAIPSVYYITPSIATYENVVNCAGTVQSGNVHEVYLQNVVVASGVFAEIGDEVAAGDILAVVDKEATGALSANTSDLFQSLSGSVIAAQAPQIDWASLAASYGLSAVVSSGLNYSGVESLLQTVAGVDEIQATSGAIVGTGVNGEISAPIAGTVTDISIRPNTPTASGKAVFTIADTSCFKVLASVSESDIAKINVGDAAKVRGVGFGGSIYSGLVSKIYPTAHKSLTGSDTVVDVEISLEGADKNLRPGFSAKVEITGGNDYELVTVPYEAVRQDENNDEYVYIYADGKLKKQVVVTGQELTNEVEILDGLDFDAIVVYNPGRLIKEGAMIHIKGRATQD